MRLGVVVLPDVGWRDASVAWRCAEEIGFDHAWTFDHLRWRTPRSGHWYAAVPTLAAAAAITSRIRLGTLVASPNLRHPVTLAQDVMTLDAIAGGRFTCGIGAGAVGLDDEALGAPRLPPGDRSVRFAEFVELTHLLLTQRVTTYEGAHYRARAAHLHPGCVQRPRVPFAIAAAGPAGMRLAARWGQSWVTVGRPGHFAPLPPGEAVRTVADQVARLRDTCEAEGRDPASLGRIVVAGVQFGDVLASPERFGDAAGALEAAGATDMVVLWPRGGHSAAAGSQVLDAVAPFLHGRGERAGSA